MAGSPSPAIVDQIAKAAAMQTRPDGTTVAVLDLEAASRIGTRMACDGAAIAETSLGQGIVPEQYLRNQKSLGTEDQLVLARSAVAVAGLGGLGGSVAEMLARIGVGRLSLIDADRFEPTNLNRQVLCTLDDLGRFKAEVAARRIAAINPAVIPMARPERIDTANASALLAGHQVVVDCLDNLPDRFALETACRQNGIPLVSGAVAGFCGQLTVIFPRDSGLTAIYGKPAVSAEGAEAVLGNLACTVSVMAGLQCAQVLGVLLTGQSPLRQRLLVMDLSDATFEVVRL
jgi:molybdopterin/thiamine biosynthesis adenylyltransferase